MPGNRVSDRLNSSPVPLRDRSLEKALAANAIDLRFQPQVEPRSGIVIGVEALARWVGEADSEALFERAKAAGLVERLSRHVQRKAIATAARWTGELAALNLSINVVAEDLGRAGYDDWLLHELAANRLDPTRLTIEITESSLVGDPAIAAERLACLRASGIRVALDDFGVGYANFAYLAQLPLDGLKIDRGLVAELASDKGKIVVRAMLAMARELGMATIVEGVETLAQLQLVTDWRCDLVQGFLAAGALDEDELARFVAVSRRAAA
jgi:EAL domain-containing protein (putative c-di-GMP-specific phosphodiesterase class I)